MISWESDATVTAHLQALVDAGQHLPKLQNLCDAVYAVGRKSAFGDVLNGADPAAMLADTQDKLAAQSAEALQTLARELLKKASLVIKSQLPEG